MTYGLNVYQQSGALTYSTTDVTWNQVDFFFVAANGSASNSYPILSGREVLTLQVLIDAPPTDRKALAHTVSVSGTTVSVTGGNENAYILVLTR